MHRIFFKKKIENYLSLRNFINLLLRILIGFLVSRPKILTKNERTRILLSKTNSLEIGSNKYPKTVSSSSNNNNNETTIRVNRYLHSFNLAKIQHVQTSLLDSSSNCYHERAPNSDNSLKNHPPIIRISILHRGPFFLPPTRKIVYWNMKLILRAKRKRRSLRFGSGYSRLSWVDRPPRGGETSRRPLRRHRPGYRCKILLSGGGGEKERGRDFNLHEAAVSSSGNYSAGLVRERHVEEGTCVGRSARGGRGREEAGEQCRGIETAREKARGTDVISSSWKSSLELGVGIRVPE